MDSLLEVKDYLQNPTSFEVGFSLLEKHGHNLVNRQILLKLQKKQRIEELIPQLKRVLEKLAFRAKVEIQDIGQSAEYILQKHIQSKVIEFSENQLPYEKLQEVSRAIRLKLYDDEGNQLVNDEGVAEVVGELVEQALAIDKEIQAMYLPKKQPQVKGKVDKTKAELLQDRNNLRTGISKLKKKLALAEMNYKPDLAEIARLKERLAQKELEETSLTLLIAGAE